MARVIPKPVSCWCLADDDVAPSSNSQRRRVPGRPPRCRAPGPPEVGHIGECAVVFYDDRETGKGPVLWPESNWLPPPARRWFPDNERV